MTRDPQWTATYHRVLGAHLRHARRLAGWTRRDVCHRLGGDLSLQTLATYELGTRSIPHVRLVHIAIVLDVHLPTLLARVHDHVFNTDADRVSGWDIDLGAASELDDPKLLPLRRWARCELSTKPDLVQSTDVPRIVWLSPPALDHLSVLCGMNAFDLARRLPRPAARPVVGHLNERAGTDTTPLYLEHEPVSP